MTLYIRLFIAILGALSLTILPLPSVLVDIRPPWILLFILYVQFYLPDYFNVIFVLLIGLLLDTLLSTVIGEHAFALLFASWLANNKARRFCFFSIIQQMALIGFTVFIYQSLLFLIDAFLGFHITIMSIMGGVAISILLWPWLRLLGEKNLKPLKNRHGLRTNVR